ncbi:MAG: phosphatase PAP2 family protein [Candidatus Aminicenantes bacterium]|nr:phosphatase PAP2 family protein [Candidatus Aminicenantes bacterium]
MDEAALAPLGIQFPFLGLGLRAADIVLMSSLLFFTVLTVLFGAGGQNAGIRVLENGAVGLVYLAAVHFHQRVSGRRLKFWIRLLSFQMMFAYVFPLVTPFQLILSKHWNDPAVLSLEQALFGVQPTVWIQKFFSPGLTEWLMAAYVAYLPLYPILGGILYFKRGELHLEDLVFKLAVANLICDLGFILFPVAGPFYWIPERFTVPLSGHVFTWMGEYIRAHFQAIGSSLPSPHCTVATIMLLTTARAHRPTFCVIAPIIVSVYVSAFYARYHYLSDVLAGIVLGAALFFLLPRLLKARSGRVPC